MVLVKLIECPPNICVTFLQNKHSQDLTIQGDCHFEGAGGQYICC
jgi:hypothetical protein